MVDTLACPGFRLAGTLAARPRLDIRRRVPDHAADLYDRFVKLSTEAGLPRISLHNVRHSYASAALASATGWHDVKVLSQRLGHANVAITLDTYSHVLPAADETMAHTLASVILGEQP